MYFLLILFFGSLLGITFMIGRKLMMLQNGEVLASGEALIKTQYLEELKVLTIKNVKKHGYTSLVATIRFYVRSTNLMKDKYQELKSKIKSLRQLNQNLAATEKKEASKFLQMISEYKHKIREIKHKIHEEEKNS